MHRPNEREFLAEVLGELPDLPQGLPERFVELLDKDDKDRASAIRALFEEYSRE